MLRRLTAPSGIFLLAAGIYVATSAGRLYSSGAEQHYGNHYVHLARSYLRGELQVVGNRPPGGNDYAVYNGKWYVSFPPFPAIVLLPFVAIWDLRTPDRLIWNLFAGLAPALLYVLLRSLRERKHSVRTSRDDLLLTLLFAFGSVYYFSAVQGTVWFAGHVVVCVLSCLYLLWSIDAQRPFLAGLVLGLAFVSRPTTAPLALVFIGEAFQKYYLTRKASVGIAHDSHRSTRWMTQIDWAAFSRVVLCFAAPILIIGIAAMWMNVSRFDDVFEFGHRYLHIRWQPRIERWGLFSYHYLGRNLAVFLASLPWILDHAPFVRISGHGLALWFTTPNLLGLLWPKHMTFTMRFLYVAVIAVALLDLLYQNTGWVQFGYRFALDYFILCMVLLALGRRQFGTTFRALAIFSVVVNTYGAITFDRVPSVYDIEPTQQVLFQPD